MLLVKVIPTDINMVTNMDISMGINMDIITATAMGMMRISNSNILSNK